MHKKDLFRMLTVGCLRVLVSGGTTERLNIALTKEFISKAPSPSPSPSRGEGYNIPPPLRGGDEGEGDGCGFTNDRISNEEMNNRGVTLVELIVVISVIAGLAIALGFSYVDWMGKYKVEKATKELYTDLMNARSMAMTRSCDHFVDFNFPEPPEGCGTYRMAEDTDDDDEGDDDSDGIIDAAGQTFLPPFAKTVEYTIENNFEDKIINFDKRGLVQPRGQTFGGTICFFTDNDPDYDCIVISQTRIIMGKLKKQPINGGGCNADNCRKK